MGSWYTDKELAKRLSIWLISGTAGQAFSGYLQAAIYKTLNGAAGLPGWRWLYIICGIMTFPCGMACIWFLPDYPATTKGKSSVVTWSDSRADYVVFYLTEEEKQMAQARCALQGIKPATGIVNRRTFLRIIKQWRFWALVPTYIVYAWGVQSYNVSPKIVHLQNAR
jgi:ACS family pantothenate transporter-like MFS transporter